MAWMARSSPKRGNYRIWALDEIDDVVHMKLSPCTTRVGLSSKKLVKVLQLNVVELTSKEVITYHSDFEVEDIKWSPNSEALLVLSLKDCQFIIVQCFDQDLTFRVQELNIINLALVEWVPDSKHLISISICNIFTFVHSLCDGRRILLPSICSTTDHKPLFAFSYDGTYIACINFEDSSYQIILISTSTWSVLWSKKSEFILIQGLDWSPNSTMLAVWDSSKHVSFLGLNGEFLRTLHYDDFMASAYLTTNFSPESDLFVAVFSRDKVNVILIYNLITWQLSAVLDDRIEVNLSLGPVQTGTDYNPAMLQNKFPSKNQLAFSYCGNFLATSMKRGQVIIWNIREGFKLSEILNTSNCFAGLQWHSRKSQLAIYTGNGTVLVWKYPQDGPIIKPAMLLSTNIDCSVASSLTWSKSNIIITSLRGNSPKVVILIKKKKK